MKIKEEIDSVIMRHNLMRNETHETIEQLEQIADNFAIGFANWICARDTKELLEIYKKKL